MRGKRDRAFLLTLLFHARRHDELGKLKVRDFRNAHKRVPHFRLPGKGGKTRLVPLHPGTNGLITDYLATTGRSADRRFPYGSPSQQVTRPCRHFSCHSPTTRHEVALILLERTCFGGEKRMQVELVDRIYECAALPQLWPDVLDKLAGIAGARGGVLFAADPTADILRWTASPPSVEDMAAYAADGVLMRSLRLERLAGARHAGFVRDNEILSADEMANDPSYRDFLRPRGLGYAAATLLPLPTGEWMIFSMEREYARGPVDPAAVQQLDALRPHLARSAFLASRLRLEQARSMTDALGLIGLPCLVFDARRVVLSANDLIGTLREHIAWRAHDRVALKDRSADALLREAMSTLGSETAPSVRSFAVRDAERRPALIAHVLPVRRAAGDVFSRSAGVLLLTPVTKPGSPPIELIQSLFDLTPAEARVARSLAAGDTVNEIASFGKVSSSTVRTHVRGVLEKTGSRRQADVIALLSGMAWPRGARSRQG